MKKEDIAQLIKEMRFEYGTEILHLSNLNIIGYFNLIGKCMSQLIVDGYEIKLPSIGTFSVVTKQQKFNKNINDKVIRAAINVPVSREYNTNVYHVNDDTTYNTVYWRKRKARIKGVRFYSAKSSKHLQQLIQVASINGIRYGSTKKVKDI